MIEALDIYPCLLPSIALADRDFLPDCRAIYFIPAGQEVIYIGKDHCLVARWEKHQKLGELASLEDVRIAWLVCSGLSNEELFRKEPEYILHSRPRLDGNRTHRPIHLRWSYQMKERDERYGSNSYVSTYSSGHVAILPPRRAM